eukprot:TRINITY_DN195_c1_g1_i1.p1 TRINITY_DN195_c1_g1~~TRINITY_DN195_c1_g1_i1.p1  ORF type:complete len:101 (-),score=36.18 TRINITY_DN195_c1_g1_i1:82-384(-)
MSQPQSSDKVANLQNDVDDVKVIMQDNIDKVIDRGEKLDTMQNKADNLNNQAGAFQKRSTQLKREMWWKNMKLNLIIGGIILIVVYFLVAAVCGFDFGKC